MRGDRYADELRGKHEEEQNRKPISTRLLPVNLARPAVAPAARDPLVVAVLGGVTNGPPSSGALAEKATSGMSLGKPSSGNSLRSGK